MMFIMVFLANPPYIKWFRIVVVMPFRISISTYFTRTTN